jgi:hypothetical protein
VNVSVRVASPGDDGDLRQSNAFVASSAADSSLAQRVLSAAPAAVPAPVVVVPLPSPAGRAPPLVIPTPPLPPVPVTVAEPVVAAAVDAARSLLAVSAATTSTRAPPVLEWRHTTTIRAVAHASVHVRHTRASVVAHAQALLRTIAVQRSTARAVEHRGKPRAPGRPTRSALRLPRFPRAPLAPIAPAASGSAGSAGHGDGGSPLTGALAAGLALVGLTVLCSINPGRVPVRRRLSDDRRARPG